MKGLPGPQSLIPGKVLFDLNRDPLAFLTGLARQYGAVAGFKIAWQQVALLSHPDLIKEVLVNQAEKFIKVRRRGKRLLGNGLLHSEGEVHKRQRRLVQPGFNHERIAAYAAMMVECAARFQIGWRDNTPADIAAEMARLTLAIAARTMFGADMEKEAENITAAFYIHMRQLKWSLLPFKHLLEKLPLPGNRDRREAIALLDSTVHRMIAARRRTPADSGDVLSALLSAHDDQEGGMTDEQVRDEALTLLTAGYETAASALTWTWYLLSLHPDVEARMHSEIDRVLGGRLPGFGDIDQLRYVGWVINESMRLYPPVWVVARRSTSPCRIGGYDFEPGTVFVLSPFVMHRHPEYFPAPEEFLPERWQGEPQHDRFAYFPFGGGPRYCIGDRFARTEAILAIATLGQKWKMRLAAKNSIALQPLVTLRPKGGLPMILQRRQAVAVSQ